MVTLNDFLYSGDTVMMILHKYSDALRENAIREHNQIDLAHSNFLIGVIGLLEHNDFLTSQSQRIREFYQYLSDEFPYLAFTFKGRIKSLIRAEEKFNGYIVGYIYDYYLEHHEYPPVAEIKKRLNRFRDMIAYRIVISLPKCHLKPGQDQETEEIRCLYEIANRMPDFLEERGFSAEVSGLKEMASKPSMLDPAVRPYYRDYVVDPKPLGYRSLHITLFDNIARCYMEVQLRTKSMDDFAEIGPANHGGYERRQENERARRGAIPEGECVYFDEAWERGRLLRELQLKDVDVNMFAAVDNSAINDGCGLYRGRLILPYEHLSRFQRDR